MQTILIGLDDTDNATSRGTGHLARQLLAELAGRGLDPVSVTRHQLPLDPRIPYTSHNSGACLTVTANDGEGLAAAETAFDFVAARAADGSDPGVCLADADTLAPAIIEFGRRAAAEVVTMDAAFRAARAAGLDLRPLGGTGLGVIGALASVGLRAGGNDGRFIELPGLRDLPERLRREDFDRMNIRLAHTGRRRPGPDDAYETFGWVRPRLQDGRAVLPLEWSEQQDAWVPVDRKRSRPLE
jgi:hypothetical protein